MSLNIDLGYKSDNKAILRSVVLVLILINEANPSSVVSLPLWSTTREYESIGCESIKRSDKSPYVVPFRVEKADVTSPFLILDLVPLKVSPCLVRLDKGLPYEKKTNHLRMIYSTHARKN